MKKLILSILVVFYICACEQQEINETYRTDGIDPANEPLDAEGSQATESTPLETTVPEPGIPVTSAIWEIIDAENVSQDLNIDRVSLALTVPGDWTCDDEYYGTNDGCECGCGVLDPDCNGNSSNDACDFDYCLYSDPNSSQNYLCGQDPPGWTCRTLHYGTDDGCDCGCGIPDPDCNGNATEDVCESVWCREPESRVDPAQNHLCPNNMPGMLNTHNEARDSIGADLYEMWWSEDLQDSAQVWANKLAGTCRWGSDPHSHTPDLGENIYMAASTASPPFKTASEIVDGFMAEQACWTYGKFMETDKCDAKCVANLNATGCGHFTQIAWRFTEDVGCGLSYCQTKIDGTQMNVEIWVCRYSPQGNIVGEYPY